MAKGKQGYKARKDESLGERTGAESKKETTPVYRNINKWVDETATPDMKIKKA